MRKWLKNNYDILLCTCGGILLILLLSPNCMKLFILVIERYIIRRESVDRVHLAEFIRCMYIATYLPVLSFILVKRIKKLYLFFPIYAISSFIFSLEEVWRASSNKGIQTICDFWDFTSIFQNEQALNYPPLANVMVHFGYSFYTRNGEYAINCLLLLMFFFSLYILFSCVSYYLCSTMRHSYVTICAFMFSILFSSPMIFAYERLNIIILAFAFIVIFLILNAKSDPFSKVLSVVTLVIAANLKYYPAVYGLILLKEKKKKKTIFSLLGGILCYVWSAIWISQYSVSAEGEHAGFSSLNNLKGMIEATTTWVNSSLGSAGICIRELVYKIFVAIGIDAPSICFYIFYALTLMIFVVFSVMTFWKAKRKDYELIMLAMLCIWIPPVSYNYVLLFLLPALVVFFNENKNEMKKMDILELFLFSDILVVSYRNYPLLLRGRIHVPVLILWGLIVFRVFMEQRKDCVIR